MPEIPLAKCEQVAQAFVFGSVRLGLEQACVDAVEHFGIRAGLHDWSIESRVNPLSELNKRLTERIVKRAERIYLPLYRVLINRQAVHR